MRKTILTITILIFTTIWSSKSFGEWEYVTKGISGVETYIDYTRIKKHDGYVYFWALEDLLKPDQDGDLSYINYYQGDCTLYRFKHLSASYYKQAMGTGTVKNITDQAPEWKYATPETIMETYLEIVCDM